MEKRKYFRRVLGGVLVGGMLLSGGIAFAGSTPDAVDRNLSGNLPGLVQAPGPRGLMRTAGPAGLGYPMPGPQGKLSPKIMSQLVSEGVISQAKADQIKAFLDKKAEERKAKAEELKKLTHEERKAELEKLKSQGTAPGPKTGLLADLVANNILTQSEADAVKSRVMEIVAAQEKQHLTDSLSALVQKGTLSQDQADKILQRLGDIRKERQTLFEQTKNMSKEERRQFFRDNKEKVQNPLKQLVTEGVITEDQAKALGQALHNGKGHAGLMGQPGMKNRPVQ